MEAKDEVSSSDGSSEELTEEYSLTEEEAKKAEESKKEAIEYAALKEKEKKLELEKRLLEKKKRKREKRDEEEKRLAKFQKIDPHFNPKLKHAKRRVEKEKHLDNLNKSLPSYPVNDKFRKEAIDALTALKDDIMKLVREHLPKEKSAYIAKYFDIDLGQMVLFIQKEVLNYYNLGLINFSVKAIMYMCDIKPADCGFGIESIKRFTELLSTMCEIIDREIKRG